MTDPKQSKNAPKTHSTRLFYINSYSIKNIIEAVSQSVKVREHMRDSNCTRSFIGECAPKHMRICFIFGVYHSERLSGIAEGAKWTRNSRETVESTYNLNSSISQLIVVVAAVFCFIPPTQISVNYYIVFASLKWHWNFCAAFYVINTLWRLGLNVYTPKLSSFFSSSFNMFFIEWQICERIN